MATLPHHAETNHLLAAQLPSISSSVVNTDDHQYQQTPLTCPNFLPTDFEMHLQPPSFQHGSQPEEKWQALVTHPEQPNRLSSSCSTYGNLALENSRAPILAKYGESQFFSDMTFGSWNAKLSDLLACQHRANGTHMSPFAPGFISENVSLVEMMANTANAVAVNGETSPMDDFLHTSPLTGKHFSYNLGMMGGSVGLAVDPSKGGLDIQDVSNYAGQIPFSTLPADTMLADRAQKLSSLNKRSTLLQSAASLVAANHLIGGARDLTFTSKASATQSISSMVPLSSAANSPSGLESFQQSAMKDRQHALNSIANAKFDCQAISNPNLAILGDPKMVSSTKPPSLPTLVEIDGSECMGKPCNSMDESDGSMGLEVSSGCDRENGWETASNAKASGKKKRVKENPQKSTMQISDGKDFDCENVKDKRHKLGDDSNEDDPSRRMEGNDSDDSTNPSNKDNSKPPETPKPDYIHVRARRGQATDSHSLAERIRREKISERMKFLQDLVPGCSKITGKAVMLDEIINYVQSLQRQVEFLSMKLAAVNPRVDFNMDSLFRRDIFPPQVPPQQPSLFSVENPHTYKPQHHQSSQGSLRVGGHGGVPRPLVDVHSLGGSDPVLRETISTPLTSKEAFGHIVSQASQAWDDELQNLVQMSYAQASQTPLASQGQQPHSGSLKPEI